MERWWMRLKIGAVVAIVLALGAGVPGGDRPAGPAPPGRPVDLGGLPLAFEPNAGQAAPPVRFLAHAPGGTLFFTAGGVTLAPANADCGGAAPRKGRIADCGGRRGAAGAAPVAAHAAVAAPPTVVQVQWVGARPAAITAGARLAGTVNYLLGDDPARWQHDLPTYDTITYADLYPGVALGYRGAGGRLKATYTLAPGADATAIRWRYDCGSPILDCGVSLAADGSLQIRAGGATLTEAPPLAWQERGGQQTPVAARYTVADGVVGFVLGAYDRALPVIIDPTLSYSSYLGGTGDDEAYGIALDSAGNVYLTGSTTAGNFPLVNPFQPTFGGGYWEAFVSKVNAAGTALVYSTYLGGSANDVGHSIAVDAAGNAYITGFTESSNFPVQNPIQPTYGGLQDVFITKLNAAGSALVYSTFLGGAQGSTYGEQGMSIAVDPAGQAYVTGFTDSSDFPTANAYQGTLRGGADMFVTKVNAAGSAWVYSTYLGGATDGGLAGEIGYAIAADAAGNATVVGMSSAGDFPLQNPIQATYGGGLDGVGARLNPAGSMLVYSTYLGGSGQDQAYALALDGAGSAYIGGFTQSTNFPTVGPYQATLRGPSDAFVTRVNAAGSAWTYSTYLGGADTDRGYGIAVDGAGQAYLTGETNSADFPLLDPLQPIPGDFRDAFVTGLTAAGNGLVYSTYLGGNQQDTGLEIAASATGQVYVTGETVSPNFPLAGPFQPVFGGLRDAFVAHIDPASPTPTPTVTGTPPTATPTRTATATGTPPTPTPNCTAGWVPASAPANVAVVGANSPRDVWAAGGGGLYRYDGGGWTPVPTPSPGLGTVVALARDDSLASLRGLNVDQYAGGAWRRLSPIPTPYYGFGFNETYDVAAYAITDVWVVGTWENFFDSPGEIWHLSGGPWAAVQEAGGAPSQARPGGGDETYQIYTRVRTILPGNAWVIGYHDAIGVPTFTPGPDLVHIGGPGPTPPSGPARVYYDVAPVGPNEAWIVGAGAWHVVGTTITYVPSPNIGLLFHVAANGPNDVWATSSSGRVIHWNGTQWTEVIAPAPLYELAAGGPNDVWATARQNQQITGLYHWPDWPLFRDVLGDSPFYGYIQALACRGLISGYTCGGPGEPCDPGQRPYYRPGAGVTRGQTAKIVANAAGFADTIPTTQQTFSDVPPSQPFWLWVERIAGRGIVSGYTCGGPGEPCDPQQRPYFRPGTNVTRGQLAKIVASAANFQDVIPTTQQTFADIPSSQPFWLWIERVAGRHIISGYQCGGPGEPCDPQSRPYFRPGGPATRAQTAKIVVNTFFP